MAMLLTALCGGTVATVHADEAGTAAVGGGELDGRADWRQPAIPSSPAPEDAAPPPRPADPVVAGNAAPTLGELGPQRVTAGKRFRLHLRVRDADGAPPRLSVRDLPDGATLVDNGGGRYLIDWTPPTDRRGRVDMTLVAVDALDERLRSERVVRLLLVPGNDPGPEPEPEPEPAPEPPSAFADESDADPGNPGFPRVAPTIEPFATQIVSAGRTVAFRVAANLPDEQVPFLQIDRLPRNASFDPAADGSRTFHWPTVDTDQGEHRFRITALHPDDETLVSRVDLLIVIGDPSRARTVPLERLPDDRRAQGSLSDDPDTDGDPANESRPGAPNAGAASDTFDAGAPTDQDEPFLPQAGDESFMAPADDGSFLPQADDDGTNYFAPGPGAGGSQGFPEFGGELPPGFEDTGPGPGDRPPDSDYFAPPDADE